jgi:hypothetical protein
VKTDRGPSGCDARPSEAVSNNYSAPDSATAAQSQSACILAVDPGLTGAVAFYCHDVLTVLDMPEAAGGVDAATLAALALLEACQ